MYLLNSHAYWYEVVILCSCPYEYIFSFIPFNICFNTASTLEHYFCSFKASAPALTTSHSMHRSLYRKLNGNVQRLRRTVNLSVCEWFYEFLFVRGRLRDDVAKLRLLLCVCCKLQVAFERYGITMTMKINFILSKHSAISSREHEILHMSLDI